MSGIGNLKKLGLDSNLFIYHFERNPEFTPFTDKIFANHSEGINQSVTSVISVIEALAYPSPPKVIAEIKDAFLNFPNLEIINLNQELAYEAARLRREYSLRLPDSVQLATALKAKVEAFITNDFKLKNFEEVKVVLLKEI